MSYTVYPHYRNFTASRERYEPVIPSQFEAHLTPPQSLLQGNYDKTLLLEHIKSIGGLDGIVPPVDAVTQKAKFTDRSYASHPSQTFVDLNFTFTLNLNHEHECYIYNMLRDWTNIVYDPATGKEGLKVDYCGSLFIDQCDRDGSSWRQLKFTDVFPVGQIAIMNDISIDTHEPVECTITFRCDLYDEYRRGREDSYMTL